MDRRWLLLPALAAVLAAGWWLLRDGGDPAERGGGVERAAPVTGAPEAPRLAGDARPPTPVEPSATPEPPAKGNVLVVTVQDDEGSPLPDARVVVRAEDGHEIAARGVDAEGTLRLVDLPAGEASVGASAPGHVAVEPSPVAMGTGEESVLLQLQRGGVVEGRVVEAAGGAPVAGALVDVRGGGELGGESMEGGLDSYGPTRTAADGRFRTAPLPLDMIVTLVVRAHGYRLAEVPMRLARGTDAHPPVVVVLEPGGTVRGSASGPDGTPLAKAIVYAIPEGDEEMRAHPEWGYGDRRALQATTDARGEYVLDGLALGTSWCVTAMADGLARAVEACALVPTAERPELVAVLRLRNPASILLRVRDSDDKPVPKQTVRLDVWARQVELDDAGTVLFAALDPGKHEVDLTLEGFVSQQLAFDLGDGERAERTVRLDRGVSIAGTLVDDEGKPVADARIVAGREGANRWPIGEAKTDAEGRFRIAGLEAAVHSLDAYGNGIQMRRIQAVAAPSEDVRLVANRVARISARVRIPEGSAPPTSLSYGHRDKFGGSAATGPWHDGAITWQVPAGPRHLRIQAEGFAPWEREIDARWGEQTDIGDVLLDVGADIEGRVLDPAGAPVSAAALKVDDHDYVSGTTDAQGRFRLRHVARRTVEIEVSANGFLPRAVEVDASRSVDPLVVTLARGGTVAGTVRDAKGVALSGASVHVFQPGVEDEAGKEAWIDADAAGAYRARILPGRYRVEVDKDDEIVATGEAAVEEGKETRLDLTTR